LKSVLEELAKSISDSELRKCVESFLRNPEMSVAPSVKPRVSLEESPAAPRKHHMYRGGLLQHTVAVTLIAEQLASLIRSVYGVEVRRDLVVAAAILHDFYKFYQYEFDEVEGTFKPRRDWYFSHDYAIVAEAARRGCPEELLRVLSEVHGTVPITTIEGLVVHLADSVDARLGEYLQSIALNVLKELEEIHGCKHGKVFDVLVSRYGFNKVLELAVKDELKKVAEAVCMEVRG